MMLCASCARLSMQFFSMALMPLRSFKPQTRRLIHYFNRTIDAPHSLPELTVFCSFSPIHLNQTQNDNPQKNALFVQDPISSQFPCWHSRSGGNGNHLLVMG